MSIDNNYPDLEASRQLDQIAEDNDMREAKINAVTDEWLKEANEVEALIYDNSEEMAEIYINHCSDMLDLGETLDRKIKEIMRQRVSDYLD